ncbi:MAG: L-ribulose-5-phosphate 4-epimerase [Spirochaetaceae bacterium 4572_59]|nr:MAG: L-ribulose-5-phosphate 4-epimerase [Spirochaetaceae bacterium 4572_59]
MLAELKEKVLNANLELPAKGLVLYTWGNVSAIDRETGIIAIKPSGISYDTMKKSDIVLIDLKGEVVEGSLNPSSDAPSHVELYKAFPEIGGICHTHSRWATIWSQFGKGIAPYGTTHADYFYGTIPCTRDLRKEEIELEYEKNTGLLIVETFKDIDPKQVPAILVKNHGPFTWGKDADESVYNSVVLEEVAQMAWTLESRDPLLKQMQKVLLDKHFLRKHGDSAYYGQ